MDRLLGRLIRRLKAQGMYDRTLIVVTADHGIAFQVGVETRRSVSASNVEELTPVPLIVKRPGQRSGRVSNALARTLDVAPTIADLVHAPLGYRADGHSAFSEVTRRRRPGGALDARLQLHGADLEGPLGGPPPERGAPPPARLRLRGQGSLLRDRPAPRADRKAGVRARSARGPPEFAPRWPTRATCTASGAPPGWCRRRSPGRCAAARAGGRRDLAVAVNGRVEAVGRSFHLRGDPREYYAMMVPEAALREGPNSVQVLQVARDGRVRVLARA